MQVKNRNLHELPQRIHGTKYWEIRKDLVLYLLHFGCAKDPANNATTFWNVC